ncbi:hypothetical protein BDZ97DRAFT_1753923 [Flammula alnicola]|nr:hypothetical protein BDZ97DRAFT_1753923 [Flammula alnicola]
MPPESFTFIEPDNRNSQKPVPVRFRGSSSLSAVKTVGTITRDSNTVLTPAGPFPKDKVHLVPKGARVHHARDVVQIIGADGTILHSSPISKSVGQARTSAGAKPATSVTQDGLVAYCHWHNTDTDDYISNFSTAWTVPNTPVKDNGQTIYIYNALSSDADIFSDDCAILQPTLQYGETDAGGGSYWAIASWYYSGTDYYN